MLTKLPPSQGPTPFTTEAEFGATMNTAGERADGSPVLAIWAGRTAPTGGRTRYEGRPHTHLRGQVLCIEDGHMQVRTDQGSWLVPPNRAVWIPGGMMHAVTCQGVSRSWNLFLSDLVCGVMPTEPCVMAVSALINALVQRAATWCDAVKLDASQRRMVLVLIDELRHAPRDSLHLPMPQDRRLARIASAIIENPSNARTKEEWATWAGLSVRTMSRQFQAQVNMSFLKWRQQALLIHALERLLKGDSVAAVSDTLGYGSPSNFIVMFRKAMGCSPAHYAARTQA